MSQPISMNELWRRLTYPAIPSMTEDGIFRGMYEDDVRFNDAMDSEDDLGRILRAHLNMEALLNVLILRDTSNAERLLGGTPYARKVSVARQMGLIPQWMMKALDKIGELRNRFAHQLEYKLRDADAASLYATLEPDLKKTVDAGVSETGGWEDTARNRMRLMFTFVRLELQYLALHHDYEKDGYFDNERRGS
jgi:hypothetical protein